MSYLLLVCSFLFSVSSLAGFQGKIEFTQLEKQKHIQTLPQILNDASLCLNEDLRFHQSFYNKYGISPFYGDQSSFSKLSYQQKKNFLLQLGKSPELVDQLRPTSCIGLTMKCLGRAFKTAGQSALWQKLEVYTNANDQDGSALQNGLQNLGWRILYWNPKTQNNKIWDAQEQADDPEDKNHFWGYHEYRWGTVISKQKYYLNKVDDASTLVNFIKTVPESFLDTPFFVGTAHAGYHVFPGSFGRVIEGHSKRQITDPQTVEESMFNPLQSGGGPRGQYYSGLIVVPPGY